MKFPRKKNEENKFIATLQDFTHSIKQTLVTKTQSPYFTRRWTKLERERLLEGLRLYGKQWNKVAAYVKTRTRYQCE